MATDTGAEGAKYTDIEEQVLFGLETIPEEQTVEIPLRDLLYVRQTIWEMIRFFRQPLHYPDLKAVEAFIGNVERGAFKTLTESYYRRLTGIWPEDIQFDLEEGDRFQHPGFPYYYQSPDGIQETDPPMER
jgi:hypothetical protein